MTIIENCEFQRSEGARWKRGKIVDKREGYCVILRDGKTYNVPYEQIRAPKKARAYKEG